MASVFKSKSTAGPTSRRLPAPDKLNATGKRRTANSRFVVPDEVYEPSPEEIATKAAELRAKRPAPFDPEGADARERRKLAAEQLRQQRVEEMEAARLARIAASFAEPGPDDYSPKYRVPVPKGGPREMSKADICNVELPSDADLCPLFEQVVNGFAETFDAMDAAERWTIAEPVTTPPLEDSRADG
jgi:hypothetical protein